MNTPFVDNKRIGAGFFGTFVFCAGINDGGNISINVNFPFGNFMFGNGRQLHGERGAMDFKHSAISGADPCSVQNAFCPDILISGNGFCCDGGYFCRCFAIWLSNAVKKVSYGSGENGDNNKNKEDGHERAFGLFSPSCFLFSCLGAHSVFCAKVEKMLFNRQNSLHSVPNNCQASFLKFHINPLFNIRYFVQRQNFILLNMQESDRYKTIKGTSEGYYKEKGSKFIAWAFHVENEEEAKECLLQMKKEYHDARHHCYALRIQPEDEFFRSSDDGEPSGTAGKPILNQILSAGLFDVLVVVIRYFGGTKLGVPGLIRSYKTATRDALEQAEITHLIIKRTLVLTFDYMLMNPVMHIVKEEKLDVLKQDFALRCELVLDVERNREKIVAEKFNRIYGLIVKS